MMGEEFFETVQRFENLVWSFTRNSHDNKFKTAFCPTCQDLSGTDGGREICLKRFADLKIPYGV